MTLSYYSDVKSTDVTLERVGGSLVIHIHGSSDEVVVESYFLAPHIVLSSLSSATASRNDTTIKELVVRRGTADADYVVGIPTDRTGCSVWRSGQSTGGDRPATILMAAPTLTRFTVSLGTISLTGKAGLDTLDGGADEDTLDGGTGEDWLYGGAGNDVYKLKSGDGADVISDSDGLTGGTMMLSYSLMVIDTSDARRVDGDLVFQYGSGDELTVENYFTSAAYRIEQFKFSDGITWNDTRSRNW